MISYRDMGLDKSFLISYDNDFFTATDRNYTQGYSFMLRHPGLKNNPLYYIFLNAKNAHNRYGVGFEHIGFTPRQIGSPLIQFGDRPFAASAMIKSYKISIDTLKRYRLVSSLNIGVIGPAAFGKEIQTGIHRAIDNVIPQGWQHQISNDIVLNYEVSINYQLLRLSNNLSLEGTGSMRVGTLYTNISTGLISTLGIVNSPFTSNTSNKRFQIYLYAHPQVRLVAYDASLQGGLFTNSVYTIESSKIERFVGQIDYGLIIQTKKLYFEYGFSRITREFKNGEAYKWGGLKFGFKI